MKRSAIFIFVFASILFSGVLARVACAQATGVTNSTSVPIPGAGHDYIEAFNEVTDPTNGSVSFRLAVPTPPGRGITLPFSFNYDTQGVYAVDPTNGIGLGNKSRVPAYLNLNGWSYSIPKLTIQTNTSLVKNGKGESTCYRYNNLTLLDITGVSRIFPVFSVLNKPYCGSSQNLTGGDVSFQASIPSGASNLTLSGSGVAAGALIAGADGMTYSWQGSVSHEEGTECDAACYFDYLATKIEDTNGNQITVTDLNGGAFSATDTLGREVISSSGFGVSGNTVTVSGLGAPYEVTWASVSHNFPMTWTLLENRSTLNCQAAPTSSEGSSSGITAITLPNGKSYSVTYDSTYGLPSKLTYPTGGWIQYVWGLNSQSATTWLTDALQQTPDVCLWRFDKPALAHRYVSYDGTNIALQQDFSYSTTWNTANYGQSWASKQTTVTTHDSVRGTSFVTTYVYTSGVPAEPFDAGPNSQFSDDELPVEQTITYQDTNGALLETVTKSWLNTEQLQSEKVTLASGQSYMNTFAYGSGGQLTEKDEYDYGQTSPTRKTISTFQAFSPTPLLPGVVSVFDKPCQTIVYDSTGTNRVAETDYLYDGGTTTCGTPGTRSVGSVSGLPAGTHDEVNYSGTSTAPRANVTSVTKQCFPSCANAMTTLTYDETGQILTMTDPCGNASCGDITGTGHTTTFSYADNYSIGTPSGNTNAYLTRVTKPVTNGISHISSYAYSYPDGQATQRTDENGESDFYVYNDSLDRLTKTEYADGAQASYTYNDSPPSPSVTTTKMMNAAQSLTTVESYDGMGHSIQTQITSITPPITANTAFDGLGNVYTISNTHVSTGSPTDGSVVYTYDALGRTVKEQEQDGSIISTTYSGNTMTVADEAGNKRETTTDALGRLSTVFEPDSSNNLSVQTTYTYDLNNNLLSVTEAGSRPRAFQYDSLSRLTSSVNPEIAGTISYTYDANGNLITKTAPAPNQTGSAQFTASMTYDALNRILTKSYTGGSPTAALSFTYDLSTIDTLSGFDGTSIF